MVDFKNFCKKKEKEKCWVVIVLVFETAFHYITLADLKFSTLLSQTPKYWDYRGVLLHFCFSIFLSLTIVQALPNHTQCVHLCMHTHTAQS
jgi:hypothetical protein